MTPTTPNALIRAMGMSDSMVIEFSTTRKHTYQYKINMNGFKLNPAITPQVRLGGVVIGSEKSTLPQGFVPAKAADCFEGVDVVVEDSGLKIPQLFVCVRNDKIKSVSFDSGDIDKKQLHTYLTKQFGSIDTSRKKYKMFGWPRNESAMTYNTVEAFSLVDRYLINDVSVSNYLKDD